MAPLTLNLREFLKIKWDYDFPCLIGDLIEQITGFSLNHHVKKRQEEEAEQFKEQQF